MTEETPAFIWVDRTPISFVWAGLDEETTAEPALPQEALALAVPAWPNGAAAPKLSEDAGNQVTRGSDGGLFAPRHEFDTTQW